jgi:hypothetical protein
MELVLGGGVSVGNSIGGNMNSYYDFSADHGVGPVKILLNGAVLNYSKLLLGGNTNSSQCGGATGTYPMGGFSGT